MGSRIRKVPAEKLYVSEPPPEWFGNAGNPSSDASWTNKNWLKSRFHFAFAEYGGGPQQFGVLRVMNDDLVQPKRGFGKHPHRDMEIVTYVVEGELTHKDSRGNKETLGRGSFQFMSAGRGIQHSEDNPGSRPLRFIQSWILPRRSNLEPTYGGYDGRGVDRTKGFVHSVADHRNMNAPKDVPIRIHQDCNAYVAEATEPLTFTLAENRMAYLLAVEGQFDLAASAAAKHLSQHDAAELFGPLDITVTPNDYAHLLLFEMLAVDGAGRLDAED